MKSLNFHAITCLHTNAGEHPFINGNGRTARAICYFVVCVKAGGLVPGSVILPELLRINRDEYVMALKAVDESLKTEFDLTPLVRMIVRLLDEQIASLAAADFQ